MRFTIIAFCFIAALLAVALWPVCVPLPPAQVAAMQPPIGERQDRDFFRHVFQQRDGQWQQCKTRLSRALFF